MGKPDFSRLNNKHFVVLMMNAFVFVANFATGYLLFHFLSIEAAGMYFFVQSFVTLCGAARTGFLSTATITFYAGADTERAATVLGSVWFLALALSLLALALNAGALLFLPYTHNEELILCIKWVGITFFATLPSDVVLWRLQADEKYMKMFIYNVIKSTTVLIAYVILIATHRMTVENVLLWAFLSSIICSLAGMMWNLSGIKYIAHRSKECMTELFHYGKYTLGTTSISVMLNNADTWIINFMLGPAQVAIYNLALRFIAFVELPIRTFLTTGMSEMAIAFNKNDMKQTTDIFKKYTGMLTIALIPIIICAVLLADIPINFLGGAKYHGSAAANVLRLFMVLSILFPLDRFNGVALDITRNTKINFYKIIIMLVLTVTFDFVGVAVTGNVYGAALCTYVVIIVAIIYGNYQLRKHMDYTIPGILSSGYAEIKEIVRQNRKPKQ